MSHWRRRSHGDLRRERMLADTLVRSRANVSRVTLRVRGSTAVLGGYIESARDRSDIISCVLSDPSIGQVIDSMALSGERPTVNVHLGKERADVRRATSEFCYGSPTRNAGSRLPTREGGPDGLGSPATRVALTKALAFARHSASRLLSYFKS